jgi:UDP-N-acetylmuramoyl-L-alanyl-D-glutamate--2,6-diaminopimelate ligase
VKLQTLLDVLDEKQVQGNIDREILDITFDSREVKQGTLFAALRGAKTDGHNFIKSAVANGAAALLVEDDSAVEPDVDIPVIKVSDSRKVLAPLSARFFDYPSGKMKMIGVTGTNGKTTTTHMISSILNANGVKTGVMGTLYVKIIDKTFTIPNTTPESLVIQRYLADMVNAGVETVIMEVSSHALYHERVAGILYDGAVFTNLSQDHLDFHKTMDDYFEAKKKLFTRIKPASEGGFALINSDDERASKLYDILTVPYISYGIHRNPHLRAENIKIDMMGTSFRAVRDLTEVPVSMKMSGTFNVYNALASVGTALFMNVPIEAISRGFKTLPGVRGRFELVDEGQSFGVVVDYAHTPDGLQNVLSSAKELVKNRLIVVFGCGGDRDRAKRPIMGEIAAKYGDVVIVTSDNPRTEEPFRIITDIQVGIEKHRKDYIVEVDRKSAIRQAVEVAESGDLIVIAGKGHETYQIFRDKTIHFDDAEVAREALRAKKSAV